MNDRPRWQRMPPGARLIGALLYVLVVSVLVSGIVLTFMGSRFLILHFLLID
jgi:cytochrome b561